MEYKNIQQALVVISLLATMWVGGCQTSAVPADTADETTRGIRSLAPRKVDVRGSIITSRYDQGQVMLEVEGFPSQDSRYNRAYVLVEPITQIVGVDGKPISLSELRQGQNVAILLRNGGMGNLVGMGVARKVWLEEVY
ncbi:hypothetical protein [Pontibacter brevis]